MEILFLPLLGMGCFFTFQGAAGEGVRIRFSRAGGLTARQEPQ